MRACVRLFFSMVEYTPLSSSVLAVILPSSWLFDNAENILDHHWVRQVEPVRTLSLRELHRASTDMVSQIWHDSIAHDKCKVRKDLSDRTRPSAGRIAWSSKDFICLESI